MDICRPWLWFFELFHMTHHDINRGCIYVGRLKFATLNQPVLPLFCCLNPHFDPFRWIISERNVWDFHGFFETSSGGDLSAAILCSGEPFEESLGQGAIAQFYLWNIRIQMRMADISHVWWFWVWFIVGFYPLTSMIFTGIIEITYNLFIFMAVHNSLLIKNLLVQSPNEPITIYPFSFWHLQSFPSLLVQNWCASRGRGGCGALKPGVSSSSWGYPFIAGGKFTI